MSGTTLSDDEVHYYVCVYRMSCVFILLGMIVCCYLHQYMCMLHKNKTLYILVYYSMLCTVTPENFVSKIF